MGDDWLRYLSLGIAFLIDVLVCLLGQYQFCLSGDGCLRYLS